MSCWLPGRASLLECPSSHDHLAVFSLVIPAKAGIQFYATCEESWIPAFAGMTRKNVPELAQTYT